MRTFIFKAVVEKDEDKWIAYIPELRDRGGATWGVAKKKL